jgi:hypothetical protein
LLLRPLKRRLGLPFFGDIARDHHVSDECACFVADRLNHDSRPEPAFVAPQMPTLDDIFALVRGDLECPRRLTALLFVLGIESTEVLANNFGRRVLVDSLRTQVPIDGV